jgi:hypothetical protein
MMPVLPSEVSLRLCAPLRGQEGVLRRSSPRDPPAI